MVGLLFRASFRYFLHHPAQLALSILGILLGIALVTAVLITNTSSSIAFAQSAAALTGSVTHRLTGGTLGIAESDYTWLMRTTHSTAAPVIIGYLEIEEELFTVQGRDFIAELDAGGSHFRLTTGAKNPIDLANGGLLVSNQTQQRLQFPIGNAVDVQLNGHTRSVRIAGTYTSDNPAATEGLLLGDIATVQTLFDRFGYIDSINLTLSDAEAKTLIQLLPSHLQLSAASEQLKTMNQMTRGFQINLTAMSLLALLIGGFLIHNSMTFSVLQRRSIFATQRLVGATSRLLFLLITAEIICISAIGSLLGIATGYALAHYLIRLTTRTINDLYFVLHVQQLWFSPAQFLLLLLLGIGTSVIAAMASAAEAASIGPLQAVSRSRVETRARNWLPKIAVAGLVLAMGGLILSWVPSRSLVLGFAAMMLFIVGYGLAIPWTVSRLTLLVHRSLGATQPVLALIAGSIHQNISRTGLAMAALTIALSATLGVDIMVGSFRHTVERWLATTLQSDIYVTVPNTRSAGRGASLELDLIERVSDLDAVTSVSTARVVSVDSKAGRVQMLALQPHNQSQSAYRILDGNAEDAWIEFEQSSAVLISEPLATRLQLERGGTLELFTDRSGYRAFIVAGVYQDYGSSHGRLTLTRDTYRRYWNDNGVSSIGINIQTGNQIESTLNTLRQWSASDSQQWLIQANRHIRERSLEVFDRTFQVTSVLRLLTVGVAFVGVFSALLALQLEKARDVAVLRAIGFTPIQSASLIVGQTLLMGFLAGVMAIPLGWVMAEILIHVINLRSFGWSMESWLPPGVVPETLALAVLSALLAGIYPMWRLSRRTITDQLRDE